MSSPGRTRKFITFRSFSEASSFELLRLSASRPSGVFASWTTGSNDSAMMGKPPVPDLRSVAAAPDRRNESTATMMNAADAINVMQRTVRPGRYVAFRKPSRAMVHHPVPWMALRSFRFSQLERNETPATSSTTPPPKNPAVCGMS